MRNGQSLLSEGGNHGNGNHTEDADASQTWWQKKTLKIYKMPKNKLSS